MYRIIRANDQKELCITDRILYIKIGQCGCYTPSTKEDAVGIALRSVPYNLLGHNEITGAETVVVSEFDGGALVAEQQRIIDSLLISALEG